MTRADTVLAGHYFLSLEGLALVTACATRRPSRPESKKCCTSRRPWTSSRTRCAATFAIARAKVPAADFRRGLLEDHPVDESSIDVVTCSLALTHVPDLEP